MADGEQEKHLDSVTDYHQEKEVDSSKAQAAISNIKDEDSAALEAQLNHERELAKIKVKPEDVQLLVKEFEMPEKKADRALRENGNDLAATIRKLINS